MVIKSVSIDDDLLLFMTAYFDLDADDEDVRSGEQARTRLQQYDHVGQLHYEGLFEKNIECPLRRLIT